MSSGDGDAKDALSGRVSSGARARVRSIVLVLDDEPVLREAILACLDDEGFEAIGAASLADARAAIAARAPDALVLDLALLEEFGAELLRDLAHTERRPEVVIVSSLPLAADIAEQYGAELLAKPFAMDDLVARLRAAESRRARTRRDAAAS